MVMYKNDSDSESEEEYTEILFRRNKNLSTILCFFVAEDSEEIYALVQSCPLSDHEQDSMVVKRIYREVILFNQCCILFQLIQFNVQYW